MQSAAAARREKPEKKSMHDEYWTQKSNFYEVSTTSLIRLASCCWQVAVQFRTPPLLVAAWKFYTQTSQSTGNTDGRFELITPFYSQQYFMPYLFDFISWCTSINPTDLDIIIKVLLLLYCHHRFMLSRPIEGIVQAERSGAQRGTCSTQFDTVWKSALSVAIYSLSETLHRLHLKECRSTNIFSVVPRLDFASIFRTLCAYFRIL